MNQNEVDYVAEDVTIRVFSPSVRPTRVPHLNKQLHIGKDVTVRYFEYEPSLAPQTRPDSAAAQVAERSLLLPK